MALKIDAVSPLVSLSPPFLPSAGAGRQPQPLCWCSHISYMKGWPGSKFSHPTDCHSWSGWCSWLDGVPFSLLCCECPLWSCTLRWRKQPSLRRKTILLAAHSSANLRSSSQEVSSVNWKLSSCQLAFIYSQCYTGDWEEKAPMVPTAVNPLNYETSLPGKMCLFVQQWHYCYGNNQPSSNWIWDLLHRVKFMLITVNLVKTCGRREHSS